jgi:RNA polymerase sigma-70 factor, ECF subfamily
VADPALRNATSEERRPDDLALRLLVLRCQTGDETAFAKLMRLFETRTLGYLHSLVGDDAEDVQQEVWLSVYRHVGILADPGAFRTWLFRTTRHRAIDFLRKRKRERELIDDVPLEELPDQSDSDEADVGQLIDEQALGAALMAMPPPQREVMLLRYRDGLSYQEIAQVIGRPIGTVRTRLHHAKKRLQESLIRRET